MVLPTGTKGEPLVLGEKPGLKEGPFSPAFVLPVGKLGLRGFPTRSKARFCTSALYGLKQAPRAWYERLRDFLLSKGFMMSKVDTTIFTKKIGNDLFVLQIYVDDIIFGSTNQDFCEEFGKMMTSEFEMSMIGELSYFLVLQSSK